MSGATHQLRIEFNAEEDPQELSGPLPPGVPLAIESAGASAPIVRDPALFASSAMAMLLVRPHGAPSLFSPAPVVLEPDQSDPRQAWLWGELAAPLAWDAFLGAFEADLRDVPRRTSRVRTVERRLDIPDGPATAACVAAVGRWRRLADLLRPAWDWPAPILRARGFTFGQGSLEAHAEALVPPPDLAVRLAEAALGQPDPLVGLAGLAVALALGQEAFMLGSSAFEPTVPPGVAAGWLAAGERWIDWLAAQGAQAIPLRVPVDASEMPRAQLAYAWLPVGTLRTRGHRLRFGAGRRDDFITRFGVRAPWDDWRFIQWLDGPRRHGAAIPTPRARPIDHAWWWTSVLEEGFDLLVTDAQGPATTQNLDLTVPWFSQALAVTAVVAQAVRHSRGHGALRDRARDPVTPGAFPNRLHPDASWPLEPKIIRGPAVVEGFPAPVLALTTARRNLAEDARWALVSHERYRRIAVHEARLLLWWARLFFPPTLDLTHVHGRAGWPEPGALVEELVRGGDPPTMRVKGGWLVHAVALYARNPAWPANMPVPSLAEIVRSTPDTGLGIERDVFEAGVGPLGAPDEVDPRAGQLLDTGFRAYRHLVLGGWYRKPEARVRAFDLVAAAAEPLPRATCEDLGLPAGYHLPAETRWHLAITAALACARFVHDDDDRDVRGAIDRLARAWLSGPEGLYQRVGHWLGRFLAADAPFPRRPRS